MALTPLRLASIGLLIAGAMASPHAATVAAEPGSDLPPPAPVITDQAVPRTRPFDLSQVHLLDGPFRHAQELERQFLLKTEVDPLLYPFRREARLPNPVKGSDSLGWGTTGHFMGHYLSACALMYRSTGDAELKQRADRAVAALAECQEAHGNGFLGGFPERSVLHLEKLIDEPSLRADVPWYCLHKIYAGLLDMHALAGNRQALEVLEKAIDWAIANTDRLDEPRMQAMLETEQGGMAELLANLHAITGKAKHLALSRRFIHHRVVDALAQGGDPLDHEHANTTIPKLTGAARQYQLTGDQRLLQAATGFWEVVVRERSYVTGGNSAYEFFSPKASLSAHVHHDTSESCNEYNMLKLTRRLFCIEPRAAYADYYERTLFNHILSTQHPVTGGQLYFQQLEAGSAKDRRGAPWGLPNQTRHCCQGTGLESHAKDNDSIYFNDGGDGLFVNLFIASTLDWQDQGLVLRQETRFPDQQATRLALACAKPVPLALHIRRPWWATGAYGITINGTAQAVTAAPGGYVTIRRIWNDGDTIEVALPMSLRLEGFTSDPRRVAVMYGPLVLAGETGPGQRFAALVTDDATEVLRRFQPVPGRPLEFEAPAEVFRTAFAADTAAPMRFKPLFRMVDETKTVYWDLWTPQEIAGLPAVFQEEVARQAALEASTVDAVLCFVDTQDLPRSGQDTFQGLLLARRLLPRTLPQLAEDTHAVRFQKGAPTSVNKTGSEPEDLFPNRFRYPGDMPFRTRYIPAGGGFSYTMRVLPDAAQRLQIRLWHPSLDERGRPLKSVGLFEVLADGQVLGRIGLDRLPFDQFVDIALPLPADLTRGKQALTFDLRGPRPIRGFYECRILTP